MKKTREEIVLKVNGKKVRLKEFPKKALKNTLLGFIKSLNLEENPTEVEIKIFVDEENCRDC